MNAGGQIVVELENGERREIPIPTTGARSLADVLAAHGLPLNTRCGQHGLCRGCEVFLRSGTLHTDAGVIVAPATIQACRARLAGEAVIQVPSRSRIEHKPQIGETFEIAVPCAHQPLFPPIAGRRDTAFAVDVGTTTVVVLLVDLVTGEVLSRAGAFNEQIRFGDNVVTRIAAARKPENLAALQRAIVMETIQPLLRRACARAGRSLDRMAGGA
ncbi:MAG: 2Fe-2S iron-sulfur cluster-binding protein, partial [Verrucomicrobiota bacterium]